MKTLILNGSPRKGGDTAALVQAVKARLQGEVEEIFAAESNVRPCTDCRYCRTHQGCAIQDGGAALLEKIAKSDRILIAAPVWFGTLPGELLSMLSRLQSQFSAEFFRHEGKLGAPKKGAILLAAGGAGSAEGAIQTATILLKQMNAAEIFPPVCSLKTDQQPASEDKAALAGANTIAEYFNSED